MKSHDQTLTDWPITVQNAKLISRTEPITLTFTECRDNGCYSCNFLKHLVCWNYIVTWSGITLSHDQELLCHMTKNYIVTWSGSTLSHDQEYMSHMIKELYYFCFGRMINVSNSIYFNLYLGFQVSKFRNTCRYIVVFWNKTINQFWEEISLTETLYIYISYLLF